MKISLMVGSYLNAGDYLIVRRCKELLLNLYPECMIYEYIRKEKLTKEKLKKINASDVMILAGGPLYLWNMYPKIMPLVDCLDNIKVPIFAMACGQKLENDGANQLYDARFTKQTGKLLDRIKKDGFSFGCRDILTAELLYGMGYTNTMVTGCAAWYHLAYKKEQWNGEQEIKEICISDADKLRGAHGNKTAIKNNTRIMMEIISVTKKKFPNAKIKVIFHRGIKDEHNKILLYLTKNKISFFDIEGSSDGFELYDACDLHIGFRVHAHIYNLSNQTRSILIEEDTRGCGVNQTLGLARIKSYDDRYFLTTNKFLEKIIHKLARSNQYAASQLKFYLDYYEQMKWKSYEWAFERMDQYYEEMKKHLFQLRILEN